MKNLKRVLSLMVALVLCLGLASVASAASYDAYPDADEVSYEEAMDVLVALGIIEGSVLSAEELNAFGELPSKDALLSQVLGTFLAPITSLAVVLDQICKAKGGDAAPAEAEA